MQNVSARPRAIVRAEYDNTIAVPFLGDLTDARPMGYPRSGYDRATWYAVNTMGDPQYRAKAVFASAGNAAIGSNQRGIDDSQVTDSYWTGNRIVNYPEQYTQQSDAVGQIWDVETQASEGLNVPQFDDVYAGEDQMSVWS